MAFTPLTYAFIAGITLFAAGLVWLFYINAKLSKEFSNDYQGLTSNIWWATVLCLVGTLIFGITGLLIAAE